MMLFNFGILPGHRNCDRQVHRQKRRQLDIYHSQPRSSQLNIDNARNYPRGVFTSYIKATSSKCMRVRLRDADCTKNRRKGAEKPQRMDSPSDQ